MGNSYIIINNGVVTFSPSILAHFPEIVATVNGNEIIVENIWREDLISIVGDNIFWSDRQDFASFSILFNQNTASVNTIDNLIVRYVNFHDGDYTIETPSYEGSVDILKDPLGLNVRPNYYGDLAKYARGEISISILANAVASAYSVLFDESLVSEDAIALNISRVSILDISKFLASDLTVVGLYNTVIDNSQGIGNGDKKYSLETSLKEFEFTENNGSISISKLCAGDEDISLLKPIILANNTVINLCVLKQLSASEFIGSRIVQVDTYFNVTAYFEFTYYTTTIDIHIPDKKINSDALGEFIAHVYRVVAMRATTLSINILYTDNVTNTVLSGGKLTIVRGETDLEYTFLSGDAFSVAKDMVAEFILGVTYPSELRPITIYSITILGDLNVGVNIINEVVVAIVPETVNSQFYYAPNINMIAGDSPSGTRYWYNNGVWSVLGVEDFSVVGTPLASRIVKVNIITLGDMTPNKVSERYNLFLLAIQSGFTNVSSEDGYSVVNGRAVGFRTLRDTEVVMQIIDAGVTLFDELHEDAELEASVLGKNISVDTITPGNMFICPFGVEIIGQGYFESGYTVTLPPYLSTLEGEEALYWTGHDRRVRNGLGSLFVNGVSLEDKPRILEILMGVAPISIYSIYSIRPQDMELIKGLLESLRLAYKEVFRFGNNTAPIENNENAFPLYTLSKGYSTLFVDTYKEVSTIAQGGEASFQSDFKDVEKHVDPYDGLLLNAVTDFTPMIFSISLTGVSKNLSTISSVDSKFDGGSFTIDSNGLVNVTYGTYAEARATKDLTSPYSSISVIVHHTFVNNILTVYSVGAGSPLVVPMSASIYTITIDTRITRATTASVWTGIYSPEIFSPPWIPPPPIIGTTNNLATSGEHVDYTFTDNGDGSVTVSYTAFDKDGNDITSQFSTLTVGDYFLHKEVL